MPRFDCPFRSQSIILGINTQKEVFAMSLRGHIEADLFQATGLARLADHVYLIDDEAKSGWCERIRSR